MQQNPYSAPQAQTPLSAAPISGAPTSASAPTRVRFLVVGLCVGMSILLYLDRFAITPATVTMLAELQLSKEQFGEAISAFFFAYAFLQMPTGWLSDTFGARWTLALYVVGWSLATIGLGLAQGLLAIWTMRLVLGAMQAGAYPTAAGLLKRWMPYSTRGLANSSVSMGGRAGLLLSLALTVPLMLLVGRATGWETDRWRVVFVLYGLLGLVWAVAFVWIYRESPRQHPWASQAEVDLIERGQSVPVPKAERPRIDFPWLGMLLSKEMWLMCGISICVNIGWVFLATWLPTYLVELHGDYVTQHIGDKEVVAGLMTACTAIAAICGGLLGGWSTDRLVARLGKAWGRRLPGMCAGLLACGMYLAVPQLTNLWLFIGAMIAIAFTIDFGLGAIWASYQDIGGRHVASVLGCGNMCGNLAAAYYSRQIGYLADDNAWNVAFYISAGAMLLAACGWLLFDATRPIRDSIRTDTYEQNS